MTSAPAIGFEYRPSPALARLHVLVICLALIGVASCGAALWLKVCLVAALVAGLTSWRSRRPAVPAAVGWSAQGGWTLRLGDGRDSAARLVSSRALGAMVVLCLNAEDGRHALWLLPDNSDADTRRRVRMRLAVLASGAPEAGD
jgi:toxin CptA